MMFGSAFLKSAKVQETVEIKENEKEIIELESGVILDLTPSSGDHQTYISSDSGSFTNRENALSIIVLTGLISIYLYLLISPSQPHVNLKPRNFILQPDTKAAFIQFWNNRKSDYSSYNSSSSFFDDFPLGNSSSKYNRQDDFFLEEYEPSFSSKTTSNEPIVPSKEYRCQNGWLSIRSEVNYKYLWMHSGEHSWMGATANMNTPLHRRAFEMHPVNESCVNGEGWIRLREGDSLGFLKMVSPTGSFDVDEWVVKIGTEKIEDTINDKQYHFLLEEGGYILNRGAMAMINVLSEADYSVRGHSSTWDRTKPAGSSVKLLYLTNYLKYHH